MRFHARRSLRLRRYDYATPGAYFATLIVNERHCLLGEIVGGCATENDAGHMVRATWLAIPSRYPGVDIDVFVVMPNHLHGIIWLDPGRTDDSIEDSGRRCLTLPDVVRAFKTLTTRRYAAGVTERGWRPFDRHLWQRSYYDRVVRDAVELEALRAYIATNPRRWELDREFSKPSV